MAPTSTDCVPAPEAHPPHTLDLVPALDGAVALHQSGRLAEAEAAYRRILECVPDQPDALHFLGVLAYDQGRNAAGLELINRSIAIAPDQPVYYNNLGNVLYRQGKLAEAAAAYRQSRTLQPTNPGSSSSLGFVLKELGDHAGAIIAWQQSLTLQPQQPHVLKHLGSLLRLQGRQAEATAVYEQWLQQDPANPVPRHLLAAASGHHPPPRAANDYVRAIFDDHAATFDEQLQRLEYRAPQLIARALSQTAGWAAGQLVILDAGCGTGLCGPLLRPHACRLTGVDLSPNMIALAKQRGGYDELIVAELTTFLEGVTDRYDLIASADTLVYFGELQPVFTAAVTALHAGGYLVFTLEQATAAPSAATGFALQTNGRYCHTEHYLQDCLRAAGFEVCSLTTATLRREGGAPVAGLVVLARKLGRGANEQTPHQLSVAQALELGVELRAAARGDEAERVFQRILDFFPDQPDALHYLGLLAQEQGRTAAALELLNRSIALAPNQPAYQNNLGNLLLAQGQAAAAAAAYRRAIALQPDNASAFSNLGLVLKDQGDGAGALAAFEQAAALQPENPAALLNLGAMHARQEQPDQAIAVYEKLIGLQPDNEDATFRLARLYWRQGQQAHAVALFEKTVVLDPHHPDAHLALGALFRQQGQHPEAIEAYRSSIALAPHNPKAYFHLGHLLRALGRVAEANEIWERWAKVEPDNPIPRHMFVAGTGHRPPPRADDDFVRATFDEFASSFDEQLKLLQYHAPELVAAAVAQICGPSAGQLDILDAGCGTGLCGPLLRPYARRLTGLDLSPNMLALAKQRGGYDELVAAELTGFLAGAVDSYDLIASADTLVYFGDLQPVLAAAARAVRPAGHLIFTLEKSASPDEASGFVLEPHGRYSHTEAYVTRCLRVAGFTSPAVSDAVLRRELGQPVLGLVVTAHKAGRA